jgi:hypothetical protein
VLNWPSAMKVIGEVAHKAVIARDSMSQIDDIAGGLLYDVPCPSAPMTSSKSASRSCGAQAKNAGIDLASRKSREGRRHAQQGDARASAGPSRRDHQSHALSRAQFLPGAQGEQ